MRDKMIAIFLMFCFATISLSLKESEEYSNKFMRKTSFYSDSGEEEDAPQTELTGELERKEHSFIPDVPDVCENDRVCDVVANYPEEHAERLLNELINASKSEANVFVLPKLHDTTVKNEQMMDVISLCESVPTRIKPLTVRNMRGEWVFVLNPKINTLHSYRVERCSYCSSPDMPVNHMSTAVKTNQTCNKGVVSSLGLYELYCFQTYINVLMYTLRRGSGELHKDWHLIPSGCTCEALAPLYYF